MEPVFTIAVTSDLIIISCSLSVSYGMRVPRTLVLVPCAHWRFIAALFIHISGLAAAVW